MARFARFEQAGLRRYGIISDDGISELAGGLFDSPAFTGRRFDLGAVKLLAPCEPPKMLAVGLNYRSHLGGRPVPAVPEIFYKPVSCAAHPGDPVIIPPDSLDPHFEGELVVVVGRTVSKASRDEAAAAVFGVTCGNDISDRHWQFGGQNGDGKDLQWWRAKGCDTFGPFGPFIVTDINYADLALTTRVNGEVLQQQRTSDLIFDIPEIVRHISHYVTLVPGDIIYTGTPGATKRLMRGDVVEVEIEGIGTLSNPVQ